MTDDDVEYCTKCGDAEFDEDGVKKLPEGEVKDRLSSQDKKDNKLKKIFSDFFVQEINNK